MRSKGSTPTALCASASPRPRPTAPRMRRSRSSSRKALDLPGRDVVLVSGATARQKVFDVPSGRPADRRCRRSDQPPCLGGEPVPTLRVRWDSPRRHPGVAESLPKDRLPCPLPDLDTIVSLAKRRGFVFPAAEIYGGFANTYDYGPLGVELKRNIREAWWRVDGPRPRRRRRPRRLAHHATRSVWVASGHVANFTDPLVDCKKCQMRWRLDHIAEGQYGEVKRNAAGELVCPNDGGELTEPRLFNMMFKTQVGTGRRRRVASPTSRPRRRRASSSTSRTSSRRCGESCRSASPRAASASATRSRPGKFIFRTLEFEQMEMEYFCCPPKDRANPVEYLELHRQWIDARLRLVPRRARHRPVAPSHPPPREGGAVALQCRRRPTSSTSSPGAGANSKGIAARTDFDLTSHAKAERPPDHLLRRGDEAARRPLGDRTGGRPRPARSPSCCSTPTTRSRREGRHARRAALPAEHRADQGRRAAALEERGAAPARPQGLRPGPAALDDASTTRRSPSAGATAARTRSARRSA